MRGRPPDHLEESTINKARLLSKPELNRHCFRGGEMSYPFDYSKKDLLFVPYGVSNEIRTRTFSLED